MRGTAVVTLISWITGRHGAALQSNYATVREMIHTQRDDWPPRQKLLGKIDLTGARVYASAIEAKAIAEGRMARKLRTGG